MRVDARTAIFMPSEKVARLSLSYYWIRRSHSVNWSKKFAAFRESQPGCMIPMIPIGPSRGAVMFLSASDQSKRVSTNCVHKEIVQLFRTKFHLKSELCNRFLSRPSECALHSASPPEKVGHLFIPRGSTCPVDAIDACTPARWASCASL